jgi:hypothetical protein
MRKQIRTVVVLFAALGLLLVSAPAALAVGPFEPNDNYISAAGPISAGTDYSGTLETSNDIDYFYFYLPQQTQLQFKTTDTTPRDVYICSWIERQYPDHVSEVSDTYLRVEDGESLSGAVTLEPGKYYFIVGCPGAIGETYTFSLAPAGVTSTYEPFALACAAAHNPVVAAGAELEKTLAKIRHIKQVLAAHRRWSFRRKQRTRAKIASLRLLFEQQQGAFNAAAASEQAACSVPQ